MQALAGQNDMFDGNTQSWGDQRCDKTDDVEVEKVYSWEGWLADDFQKRHNLNAQAFQAMRLPASQDTHPLTQQNVTVHFAPTPGPLHTLNVKVRERATASERVQYVTALSKG